MAVEFYVKLKNVRIFIWFYLKQQNWNFRLNLIEKNYKNLAHRPIIVTIILVLRKPLINHLDESPDIIKAANFDKNLAISLKTV